MAPQGIFPSCYFAPIAYYAYLLKHKTTLLDVNEHFVKQTFRNRCSILSPNGKLDLIIPLQKAKQSTPIKEIKIAYTENWQKNHWKSFEAAYRRSPYFEYYEADFAPFFYEKTHQHLVDFNEILQSKIISLLDMEVNIIQTKKYEKEPENTVDYRKTISPKNKKTSWQFNAYIQVFAHKVPFISNLSILDLLFNEGSNALNYLKNLTKIE